ncbi:MAG: transposase [Halioglobus sp.]
MNYQVGAISVGLKTRRRFGMTAPRSAQISLVDTPYYHCIARCVRRAFLCGNDRYTGRSFNHRRQWLVDRIRRQARVFGIDVCAYAVMGNHYHLVLRVDKQFVLELRDVEVLKRWTRLFRGPHLIRRYLDGLSLSGAEMETVGEIATVWRRRLHDISWFMRCLNEYIARRANAEDECSGRFWEGRFKSRALLDDAAVLSCMAYVDLNPVRAGMARSLSDSDFTSIQERLRDLRVYDRRKRRQQNEKFLLPFKENDSFRQNETTIPLAFQGYLGLLESTAYLSRGNTPRSVWRQHEETLHKMGLSVPQWSALSLETHSLSLQAIGGLVRLQSYCRSTGRKWVAGARRLKVIYGQGLPGP